MSEQVDWRIRWTTPEPAADTTVADPIPEPAPKRRRKHDEVAEEVPVEEVVAYDDNSQPSAE